MIARLREWLRERHDARRLPDPTFGPRMTAKHKAGQRRKLDEIRVLREMGVDYGEINRVAFGRPPWTERKEERP